MEILQIPFVVSNKLGFKLNLVFLHPKVSEFPLGANKMYDEYVEINKQCIVHMLIK